MPDTGADQAGSQQHTVLLVTAGYDHTIRFWEALSGICSHTIQHPNSQVNRLCISNDKRFLAAAAHSNTKLYDIASGSTSPIMTFDGHTNNVTGVQFHCDGKWLATCSEDGTVKIWDTRAPTLQRKYDHRAPVNDVVIHPNQGELLSCDQNGSVKVWDLAENACTHELVPEEDAAIRSLSVASDGSMLVAGTQKGNCYVWSMINQRDVTKLQPITKFQAHNAYLTRCVLSPDVKQLATCSADTTVRIWSTENFAFEQKKELRGHQRWVWDCAFSADSAYLVTASSDHVARLWELGSGETIRQYNGHHKATCCIALNDGAN